MCPAHALKLLKRQLKQKDINILFQAGVSGNRNQSQQMMRQKSLLNKQEEANVRQN